MPAPLDPAAKAAAALDVAERKLAKVETRIDRAKRELDAAQAQRAQLVRERDYLAANPYLVTPETVAETALDEADEPEGMTTDEAVAATALKAPGPA